MTTSDSMDEKQFAALSRDAIDRVRRALDAVDPDVVEAVLEAEVLKIQFPSGAPFVLNTQRPLREIWLAADRQAWHFRYDDGAWIEKKNGDELWSTLTRIIRARCQADVVFAA